MATDLYGIRVLDVAPDESRVRFRVFVVYYDTESRTHASLPDDPSFFFTLLWEATHHLPISSLHPLRMVGVDQVLDPEWVAAHTHRYVRRIERIATRNHPVAEADWQRLHDFYYERDGRWKHEDLLVQADYDVEVTDPRWLGSLSPGHGWATTFYAITADQVLEEDAPTVLDLRRPAVTLDPFPGEGDDDSTPSDLAFSDDGRYLAVTSQACELVVFRTDDWSEHVRVPYSSLWGQDIQWVPGTHQITKRVRWGGGAEDAAAATRAYDVDSGAEVDVPPQPREARSRTGRYRADTGFGRYRADGGYGGFTGYGAWVDVLCSSGASPRRLHLPRGKARAGSVSFTGDETRMFVGQGGDVHILDPETGRVLTTLAGIRSDAIVRPDGAYLVTGGGKGPSADETEADERIDLWRVSDGALLMRCRTEDGDILPALGWSPDGSMLAVSVITGSQGYGGEFRIYRAGAPVGPPQEANPTVEELRKLADDALNDGDTLFLYDQLIEREEDPAALARVYRKKADLLRERRDGLPGAAEAYRRSIETGGATNAMHASYSLASVLVTLEDFDGAVEAARTAHRIAAGRELDQKENRKTLAEMVLRLGDMLRTRGGDGDNEEARAAYQQALDLEVKGPAWATLGLGWTALNLGDAETAETYLLRAVELAGSDLRTKGYATMLLGRIAKGRRDLPGALKWYQMAFKADSIHRPLATGHLGELHYWLGDRDGARTWYERLLKATHEPELVAEGAFRLGEMAAEDGDRGRAGELLERAAATGSGEFAGQARELLGGLSADTP
ncbi:WD40 repeat domain-containing protein [Streptomyces sp. ME19-01-6]|uniref:WD40 repeat domain-containing protein n=1 Tax=Streptomyces sp. ME19-01-6 TaxID=3028686 RepID=UPI0029B5B361|nr:WD40 repeat domain-containing protein [Streptomyces sp. ME19-01-6]MDX3227407.1 WD40 repeat domain-containing protein [Streptomyces sp. ME19-01-6]